MDSKQCLKRVSFSVNLFIDRKIEIKSKIRSKKS
jgi:hypothetical protein